MSARQLFSLALSLQFYLLVCSSQTPPTVVPCIRPWTVQYEENATSGCECGDTVQGVVKCDPVTFNLDVLYCYCLTFSDILNTTVVGYCLNACHGTKTFTTIHAQNTSDLNKIMCGNLERTGQMCGSCKEGYATAVYSYSMACVECSDYKHNWLKYIVVAFMPLTLFYIMIVAFRINVFSGSINATILVCQLLTVSAISRYYKQTLSDLPTATVWLMQMLMSAYSVWNLDFFRTVYTPFCLNPKMTTLQVLAMDYIIALYPLLLIMLTYLCVKLHDRYRIVIWLWSPFQKCLSYFHKEWNVRRSLVDVFATFFLLSYVKILDISFNILSPTSLWNVNGKQVKDLFLYFDGTVKYFQGGHIPFAVLAIGMLCSFNIIPLVLLAVYPSRCFQKCLNYCHCQCQVLKVFMDTFQGGYKTNPYDCRYFAAFYLLLRFLNLTTMEWTKTALYFPLSGLLFGLAALTVALIRPWNVWWHNVIDSIVLSSISLQGILFYIFGFSVRIVDPNHSPDDAFRGISASPGLVPGVIGTVLVVHTLFPKSLVRYCKQKIIARFSPKRSQSKECNERTPLMGCAQI